MSNRREFIRRSAAAAAGASLLTSVDFEDADAAPLPEAVERIVPRDNEPVRIGIIGTGGMGTEHCRAFMRLLNAGKTDVQVSAIADVCVPRLQAAYTELTKAGSAALVMRDVKMHTDYRALLRDKSLHGVLIAVPEHWHGRISEDALAAGKAVYVEKPMTLNLKDALRLRRVVRSQPDSLLLVGTQFVMYPAYQQAARLIAEGTLGKPTLSQTSYCRNSKDGEWLYYKIDPDWQPGKNLDWRAWCGPLGKQPWDPEVYARWRRYRKYSTGIIGDLLVHYIAPLVQALNVGWPTRVVASGGRYVDKQMENHDQININVEFEGQHTMIVAGSTSNEVGLETLIRTHKANLYLASRKLTMRPERIYADELEEKTFEGEHLGDAQDLLRLHWLDAIRNKQALRSDVELGTKVMVVVDLATRSIWDGKAYGFDSRRMKAYEI